MSAATSSLRADFRQRLAQPRAVVTPGIFDALSALLAEQAGFEAVFVSGSAVAFSQLARPDVGLVTADELAATVARVAERVQIPVLVDIDSAFGGAPQAARLMRTMERAGAAMVQVEDQQVVKPNDALTSRPLVPVKEMQEKIGAMLDSRESPHMLLSARTDTRDPGEVVERCLAYREAGADLVFPEGTTDGSVLRSLRQALDADAGLVYNNHYPDAEMTAAAELEALGINIVLYPTQAIRAAMAAMQSALTALAADPSLHGGGRSSLGNAEVAEILDSAGFMAHFKR